MHILVNLTKYGKFWIKLFLKELNKWCMAPKRKLRNKTSKWRKSKVMLHELNFEFSHHKKLPNSFKSSNSTLVLLWTIQKGFLLAFDFMKFKCCQVWCKIATVRKLILPPFSKICIDFQKIQHNIEKRKFNLFWIDPYLLPDDRRCIFTPNSKIGYLAKKSEWLNWSYTWEPP